MARKELKHRPQRYEEIKGIGSTRAQELRNELGPLSSLRGSRNFLQNKLGQLSSGDRRNLPKFAENLISAVKGGDREAVEAVDSSLVREIESNNPKGIKSPQEKRKETLEQGNFDTSGDFGMASRFDEALEAFSEEYQGETTYTGPDPTAIREGVEESDAPEEFVGVVPSAVNQRTFLQFPTEENFEQNVRKKADQDDAIEPAKDAFVNFVDRDIGLGGGMLNIGGFEVEEDKYEQAQERNAERSPRARDVDKQKRAPVTTNYDQWADNPRFFDFPGIDTPTDDPQRKDSDLPFR